MVGQRSNLRPIKDDLAVRARQDAYDAPQKSGFADTIATEKTDQLVCTDEKIDRTTDRALSITQVDGGEA
jgi:hypothetical protein